jgi:hypothetical protein
VKGRLGVAILAILAIPVIATALLVAFGHDFVREDLEASKGRVIEGAIWIVAGLIAWWRVPGNRIGPLATAFGFVDIADQLTWNAALPFSLAQVVSAFVFAIGVHLFLAFPSGRLQTRSDRAVVAFAYGVYIIAKTMLYGDPVRGYPTLVVVVLFLGGLQLMALGIIGEYLARMFVEVKQRPLFILQSSRQFLHLYCPFQFPQPSVEIGQRAEENQVSNTSESRMNLVPSQSGQ